MTHDRRIELIEIFPLLLSRFHHVYFLVLELPPDPDLGQDILRVNA